MKKLAWCSVLVLTMAACGGSDSGGGACPNVVTKAESTFSKACEACIRSNCCAEWSACVAGTECNICAGDSTSCSSAGAADVAAFGACGVNHCPNECPSFAPDSAGTGGGSAGISGATGGASGTTGGTGGGSGGTGGQSTGMTPPSKETAKQPKMPLDTSKPGASEMADDANACQDSALEGLGICGNDTTLLFCSDGALWALDCEAAAIADGLTDGACEETEKLVTCTGLSAESGPDSCEYANDGACDDPEFCAADTDTTDCTADACEYANDGTCDVPAYCVAGTDVNDCARADSCATANDGQCDEPNACDAGTDSSDCAADSCAYANDGVCDEPESCDEGTDTTDCTP